MKPDSRTLENKTPDSNPSAALDFTLQVERLYAALLRFASPSTEEEQNLGGKLLYAGELAAASRALVVAANIAGAASLAATADATAQKQAVRDGVADFLVNSLDEALRILKNEIRKRETVAACIASAPQAVEREMLERGVVPDLLAPLFLSASPSFGHPVPRIELFPVPASQVLVTWRVATAPAQWLPKLDAIALGCLPATLDHETRAARRWLRLAPRYLGRLAQGARVLRCETNAAKEFVERVQNAIDRGEIATEVHIETISSL
ncbi:MAG: hypothetical protein ACLPY1_03090 [Terracidiphilus sp.]